MKGKSLVLSLGKYPYVSFSLGSSIAVAPPTPPARTVVPSLPPLSGGIPRPTFVTSYAKSATTRWQRDGQEEWNTKVNEPLKKILDFFAYKCIHCFFNGLPNVEHQTDHCGQTSTFKYLNYEYADFQGLFGTLPSSYCYGCLYTTKVAVFLYDPILSIDPFLSDGVSMIKINWERKTVLIPVF